MFYITVDRKFCAGHFLKRYKGKCKNPHGHTWKVAVKLQYTKLNKIGLAVDFKKVKKELDKILPDHKFLNEIYSFNPTAENLAEYFYTKLKKKFKKHLVSVRVWESSEASCEYTEN